MKTGSWRLTGQNVLGLETWDLPVHKLELPRRTFPMKRNTFSTCLELNIFNLRRQKKKIYLRSKEALWSWPAPENEWPCRSSRGPEERAKRPVSLPAKLHVKIHWNQTVPEPPCVCEITFRVKHRERNQPSQGRSWERERDLLWQLGWLVAQEEKSGDHQHH